jgi:DNA-binding FadR family transcriptional regulator
VIKAVEKATVVLTRFIAKHGLKSGDRLPPERDLATELQISRRALRQELGRLELVGEIWRGKKNGTFLGGTAPSLLASSSVDRSLSRASPADIMECRLILEPAAAALAASKATEADLAKIENCASRTGEITSDAGWSEWDSAFHSAVAAATRNEVLIELIRAFNVARRQPQWSETRLAQVTQEKRRRQAAAHREISVALRRRSTEEAGLAMRRHLLQVRDDLSGLFV